MLCLISPWDTLSSVCRCFRSEPIQSRPGQTRSNQIQTFNKQPHTQPSPAIKAGVVRDGGGVSHDGGRRGSGAPEVSTRTDTRRRAQTRSVRRRRVSIRDMMNKWELQTKESGNFSSFLCLTTVLTCSSRGEKDGFLSFYSFEPFLKMPDIDFGCLLYETDTKWRGLVAPSCLTLHLPQGCSTVFSDGFWSSMYMQTVEGSDTLLHFFPVPLKE